MNNKKPITVDSTEVTADSSVPINSLISTNPSASADSTEVTADPEVYTNQPIDQPDQPDQPD